MADTKKSTRPRLGRGLSSLISPSTPAPDPEGQYEADDPHAPAQGDSAPAPPSEPTSAELSIAVADIAPNPYQPRRQFDEAELAELADSIAEQGIIQPLIIVKTEKADTAQPYALIAGERRLRAAKRAGLANVPCIVREATRQQMIEWALVENIQRSDLNPLERALAYQQYMDRFSLTHAQVAQRLGQARTTVSNHLRLLDLPESCRELISQGTLTFGHAKVLAGLAERPKLQVRLAKRTAAKGLSVRHLEALAVAQSQPSDSPAPAPARPAKPPYVRDLEERLTHAIGTRVAIRPGRAKNAGKIVIEYYSLDDFDRIARGLGMVDEGQPPSTQVPDLGQRVI